MNEKTSSEESGVRVIDAVLVARSLLQDHQERTGSPITTPIPLLGKGGILRTIELTSGLAEIKTECVKWPGDICRGWVERRGDRGHITYSSSLNTCWARFVICKEAAHLAIGDDGNFTTDPVRLVTGILASLPPLIDAEVDAEGIALLVAMNILIPWELADSYRNMRQSGMTNYEIAYELRVPELLIDMWFTPQLQQYLALMHGAK